MAKKRRKFDFFKLTISGLKEDTDYRIFLRDCRSRVPSLESAIWEHGGKSHALQEARLEAGTLVMKFLSFKTGFRPDILDVEDYEISPNPLSSSQTGVAYTHALLADVQQQWILIIEKLQDGIYPNTLGQYLDWMVNEVNVPPQQKRTPGSDIIVSVEPEPGSAFIARIDSLDRVTKATLRIVTPNPGWEDLEGELASEANDSNAKHVDVSMTSVPRASLDKDDGILQHIKALFRRRKLGYASVQGTRNGEEDKFTTEQMGRKTTRSVELDQNGQVVSSDAFDELKNIARSRQQEE